MEIEPAPRIAPKPGPALVLPHAEDPTIRSLREDAADCTRCDLYRNATQTVFGEGDPHAPLLLVGEQPGDKEDIAGRPFVGPAGRLLDECLVEAGIDRGDCYVTNAVKHFKFTPRGKKRLHSKPNAGEIQRCSWWLGAELDLVKPKLVVALGATALYALFGRSVQVTKMRGRIIGTDEGSMTLVTVHPSSLLRAPDHDERVRQRKAFVRDLVVARDYLGETGKRAAS